jgi:hypothetical protein
MKKILAIVTGVVTGFITTFIGDATVHAVHPLPSGLNYMDKNVMTTYVASIPTYVFAIMILFWALSSFLGGMLAARICRPEWKRVSLSTGAILMAAAILNLILVSHSLWLWVATLLIYLPAAFLGGWLARGVKGEIKT